MARSSVRSHSRRTASGGRTTVQRHQRGYRPGRGRALVSPGHAWRLIKRAVSAGRRRHRWAAAGFTVLALAELVAWLTLQGAMLAAATAAVLAGAAAVLAALASGWRV